MPVGVLDGSVVGATKMVAVDAGPGLRLRQRSHGWFWFRRRRRGLGRLRGVGTRRLHKGLGGDGTLAAVGAAFVGTAGVGCFCFTPCTVGVGRSVELAWATAIFAVGTTCASLSGSAVPSTW